LAKIIVLILFHLFIFVMLVIDLGFFNKKAHKPSLREAIIWSIVWITCALLFNGGVFYFEGNQKGMEFLTGYIVEKALSVDNIFVFVLVFSYFSVSLEYQHKILFWGILGALFMRASFILLGTMLITRFHFILYIFGVILVYGGYKMMFQDDGEQIDPGKNPFLKLCRKIFPMTPNYNGSNFFVREGLKIMATPLLAVLVVIETTDLLFAVDSIPAVFAITQDAFIVYTSNIFAILGLRSLYFVLAGVLDKFIYLKYGLSIVLAFIGVKMLIIDIVKIPTFFSLMVVCILITGSVILSLFAKKDKEVVLNE
jgi:tellurite resistance protein TerC